MGWKREGKAREVGREESVGEKGGGEKCEGGKWLDKIKEDYKERKR